MYKTIQPALLLVKLHASPLWSVTLTLLNCAIFTALYFFILLYIPHPSTACYLFDVFLLLKHCKFPHCGTNKLLLNLNIISRFERKRFFNLFGGIHLEDSAVCGRNSGLDVLQPRQNVLAVNRQEPLTAGHHSRQGRLRERQG